MYKLKINFPCAPYRFLPSRPSFALQPAVAAACSFVMNMASFLLGLVLL